MRYAVASAVLLAGVLGVVPARPALLVGTVLAALAALANVRRWRTDVARRDQADALIADVPGPRVPEAVRWRADELRDPRERRLLARALRGVLRDVEAPPLLMLMPANRPAVRANRAVIADLASLLAAVERPIDPRGAARISLLLARADSPLYDPAGADALHRELVVARRSLVPDR